MFAFNSKLYSNDLLAQYDHGVRSRSAYILLAQTQIPSGGMLGAVDPYWWTTCEATFIGLQFTFFDDTE